MSWTRRQHTWVLVITGTPTCYVTKEEVVPSLGLHYSTVGLESH